MVAFYWTHAGVYITSVEMCNYLRFVNEGSGQKPTPPPRQRKQCGALPRPGAPWDRARVSSNRGKKGLLNRLSRGIYVSKDAPIIENHSLVEAAKRVPHGVICLLSALQFHDLTTQSPFEVWMAIGQKARTPKLDKSPAARCALFSR